MVDARLTSGFARRLLLDSVSAIAQLDGLRSVLHEDRRRHSFDRTFLVAVGKAALSMSAVLVEEHPVAKGIVVVPHGYLPDWTRKHTPDPVAEAGLCMMEAGHPVADSGSRAAAEAIRTLASETGPNDRLVALVSGGGSALIGTPISGVSVDDYFNIAATLYKSGAPIDEVNLVRRAISDLAGGGLTAAASPARVDTYIMSDVPNDNPRLVASGPTFPLDDVEIHASGVVVERHLGPGLARMARKRLTSVREACTSSTGTTRIVARNADAVSHLGERCQRAGMTTRIAVLAGEARDAGRRLAREALRADGPMAIVLGGETTVTVTGTGRGGRCQEFVASAAAELAAGGTNAVVACIGTDGRDGPTDAAGAAIDVAELSTQWVEAIPAVLANNDSYGALDSLGALIRTGPSHVNVMDVGLILVGPNP